MIKIYQKQPIQAEQFNGNSDSAKHLGVEWDEGNGFIGDPSYTPESQPCWYIPEDKFTVFGYDENSIKPGDWVIECSENIRLIMTNNEFKKYYAELPVIPDYVDEYINYMKSSGHDIWDAIHYSYRSNNISEYMEDNSEKFARAWLDGYQVEASNEARR